MAQAAPTVEHTSAKAGRSPEANNSRRCQDLGNIVHLEHLNLEASISLIASVHARQKVLMCACAADNRKSMLSVSQSTCLQLLQVSDTSLAAVFYGEGLGLTADPGSTAAQRGGVGVTWYNIGRQQVSNLYTFYLYFHLHCILYLSLHLVLVFVCSMVLYSCNATTLVHINPGDMHGRCCSVHHIPQ